MAQSFVTDKGVLLIDPGTYVETEVKSDAVGAPTIGVVTLIGEADEGPDWTLEDDINTNEFTPSQLGEVIQKYGSGRLVDAFRKLTSPSADPAIAGSVTVVKIIKTNKSQPASSILSTSGVDYGTLSAQRRGKPGNLIKRSVSISQAEDAPSTGLVAYTPDLSITNFSLRANGSAKNDIALAAKSDLDTFVASLTDIEKGLMVTTDGVVEPLAGLNGAGASISATVDSATGNLIVSLTTGDQFVGDVEAGDTVVIPDAGDFGATGASVIAGGSSENVGSYVIVSVTNTTSSAQLVLKPINTTGSVTAAGPTTVSAEEKDILVYKNVELENKTGQDRFALEGISGTFTTSSVVNGVITLTSPSTWAAQPQTGDLVTVEGADAGLNLPDGFYEVVSADETSMDLIKLDPVDIGSGGGSFNQVTAITGDYPIKVKKPVIDGLGKTLEIVDDVSSILRNPSTTEDAGLSNSMLTSDAELEVSLSIARGSRTETFAVGGNVAIEIGSTTDGATVTIDDEKITLDDGSVETEIEFSQFSRLSEVVDFINSLNKYHARLTNARFGLVKSTLLDKGTFGISAATDEKYAARIKTDLADFELAVDESTLVNFTASADSGLPEENTTEIFLSGGTRAGSTGAEFINAVDAAENIDTNFVVPLVSQDASEDITDGDTDLSSTYTVDALNAYVQSHVLKMSQVTIKKHRLAICSKASNFTDAKEAAGQLSTNRVALAFQPARDVSAASGAITTFQPWMTAVTAAGMQAAGTYKGIVKKQANLNGVIDPEGFNSKNIGNRIDALKNGLLFLEPITTGGFRFNSDQMTYSIDSNFVFNSLQANYLSDLVTLDLIETFDRLVVGQSIAEMTAPAGLSVLLSRLSDYRRLKWIARSDDAPLGFKNENVQLRGGVMIVQVEIKLAGLIYFVPISVSISEAEQTA